MGSLGERANVEISQEKMVQKMMRVFAGGGLGGQKMLQPGEIESQPVRSSACDGVPSFPTTPPMVHPTRDKSPSSPYRRPQFTTHQNITNGPPHRAPPRRPPPHQPLDPRRPDINNWTYMDHNVHEQAHAAPTTTAPPLCVIFEGVMAMMVGGGVGNAGVPVDVTERRC